MVPLECECSRPVYCDNTLCLNCDRLLAFDPFTLTMHAFRSDENGSYRDAEGNLFHLCANRERYGVCNGLVLGHEVESGATLCAACRLNRTVPCVDRPENLVRWRALEVAKRRMLAGLTSLGLRVDTVASSLHGSMQFDFIEDQRSHPDVLEHFVSTGHSMGLITINLIEADPVHRTQQQEFLAEPFRTLLGHFRHEAGHYFYSQLVTDIESFSRIFGDPQADYNAALQHYYNEGPPTNWGESYVSAYASSHPMEDWAECFAQLLHMEDMLETAVGHSLLDIASLPDDIEEQLDLWRSLSVVLNEMSRSVGAEDLFPFYINETVGKKLAFIQRAIGA